MFRPTRLPYRVRLIRLGGMSEAYSQPLHQTAPPSTIGPPNGAHGRPLELAIVSIIRARCASFRVDVIREEMTTTKAPLDDRT